MPAIAGLARPRLQYRSRRFYGAKRTIVRPCRGGDSSMKKQMVRELRRGEWYEYVPLGKYVVSAPEVCRGRPTFKYTRIEVAGILDRIGGGHPIDEIVT